MKITSLSLKIIFSTVIFCTAVLLLGVACLLNLNTINYRFEKKGQIDLKINESELTDIEKKIVNLQIPDSLISKFNRISPNTKNTTLIPEEINDVTQDMDGYRKSTVHLIFSDSKLKLTSFDKIVDFNYKRFVSFQDNKISRPCFFLAAGDSYTYGYGVNQGNDYPSQLAKTKKQKCFIYNYGVNGDSANDFYSRLTLNSSYLGKVKEKTGVFVWIYINAQMQRLILPSNAYTSNVSLQEKSEFSLRENDIFYHGTFAEKNTWQRKIFYILSLSSLVKTFNLEIPKVHTEEHYQLFIKLLDFSLEIISQDQKSFTGKYIVLYDKPFDLVAFEAQAKNHGFITLPFYKILNHLKQQNAKNMNLTIPFDNHPTSESYYLLANYLNQYIYNSHRLE